MNATNHARLQRRLGFVQSAAELLGSALKIQAVPEFGVQIDNREVIAALDALGREKRALVAQLGGAGHDRP